MNPTIHRVAALFIAVVACAKGNTPNASETSRADTARVTSTEAIAAVPIPFEDSGACPFEGCTYRMWKTTKPVDLRAARSTDAPVTLRIPANTWVRAVTGVVATTVPGIVRFRSATNVEANHDTLQATASDTVFVLRPEGEGYVTAWFKGKIRRGVDGGFLGGACPPGGKCGGYVVSTPTFQWWVNVRDATGHTGWTNDTKAFTCTDRFGGNAECDANQPKP